MYKQILDGHKDLDILFGHTQRKKN